MMGYQSFVNARQGHLYQHLPLPLPHQQQKSIHYFENEKTYIYIYREREEKLTDAFYKEQSLMLFLSYKDYNIL